jgi:hypothetical protein
MTLALSRSAKACGASCGMIGRRVRLALKVALDRVDQQDDPTLVSLACRVRFEK